MQEKFFKAVEKSGLFFISLEMFKFIGMNLKRTCRRLQNTNFKMQVNILRYYLRYTQIFINCGNFPRKNQATSTELYITTCKNAFDTAEVLKTFEIQQYIGFFVNAGLLELFTVNVRPVNIKPAMQDY